MDRGAAGGGGAEVAGANGGGRRTAEAKGVQAPNLVLLGGDDPARAILKTAKREQADLIAMGSRGLGGVEGLLSGSVSYKVIHTAPCSCMVVR